MKIVNLINCSQAKSKKQEKHATTKKTTESGLVLPLYFGWEIAIRRIKDWKKQIIGPFKKRWQYTTIVMLLIISVSAYIFFSSNKNTLAATKNFIQASWNTLSSNTATNSSDRTGWTQYSATSTSITASSTIMLATTASSTIQTNDADFTGTVSNTQVDTGNNRVILATSVTTYSMYQTTDTGTTASPGVQGGWNNRGSGAFSSTEQNDTAGDGASVRLDGTGNWTTIQTLDSTGTVGQYTDVAMGLDGFARISYYDSSNTDLKFIQCTNADCSTKNTTTIDTAQGMYTSIAIASDGFARISYTGNSGLKFVQCTNASCSTKNTNVVDAASGLGYDSLTLDSNGYGMISYDYFDGSNNNFKFTQCTNAACSAKNTTTIGSYEGGVDTSIAIGADGFARISYYKPISQDLRYAQCNDAACSSPALTTVDSTNIVGRYSSIAIGSDDFARISYYYGSNGGYLKFAQCTNASCSTKNITTVDSTSLAGQYSALALGSDGFARISYQASGSDLKFTQCTNASCSAKNTYTIDVATYSSIAIASDGFAQISYFDAGTSDLNFVRGVYLTPGTYTSYVDAGTASPAWSTFQMTKGSTSGGGGSIAIKIKASSSSVSAPTFDATGAACSFTVTTDGSSGTKDLTTCSNLGSGQYLWYEATLSTSDTTISPLLNDVLVTKAGVYESPGTYTSAAMDSGQKNTAGTTFTWDDTLNSGTITMEIRGAVNSGDLSGKSYCSISKGEGVFTKATSCVETGSRYFQYRSTLNASGDLSQTPYLNSVTITSNYYPSGQTLTSSAFNSENAANVMGGISWDENSTLPSGTFVALQLRASSSAVLLSTTDWSVQLTSTSTSCSKIGGTVTCLVAAIPANMKDGTGDQWFQYKVYLSSDGANSPQVDNINVAYVVNDPPEVQSVTASSTSSGLVSFSYQVRDPDTDTGSPGNQYLITPSFQYSTNGGTSWIDIVSDLSTSATSTKTVATSTWNTYYATWNAKNAINNTYSTTFQIKAIVNDGEAANFTASSTSANFTVDTKNPASPSIVVVATTTPASLRLSATDDSSLEMRIGLLPNTTDGSWVTYAIASTISITDNPETVYVQYRDAYGNTSAVASAVTPETPTAIMIQDTSNLNTTPIEYRLFVAWQVVNPEPTPGFAAYKIYRSTDNITYTLRSTETDININSYADSSVSYNTVYYYKVYTLDDAGNASYLSASVNGNANGTQDAGEGGGGSDTTAPAISAINNSAATTQSVTITWTTNELSNSTVGYCLSPCTDYTTQQGVASYVTSHSVVLTGLTPATTYDYKVISTDPSSNTASTTGNSFVTSNGPSIIANSVSIIEVTNTTAKITWDTDVAASGYVVYSTISPPSGTESFTDVPATSRTITLSGLSVGTKYYFYVKSRDGSGNWAYNYNDVSGTRNYFNFTTDTDTTAPTITFNSGTDITSITDNSATVSWTTNETATSTLEYGFTTSYASSTLSNNNYNSNHSFDLSGLTAGTLYYLRLKSTDANGNTAMTTSSFTTTDSSDIIPPSITSISANPVYDTVAVINWTTSESATSVVNYGTASGVYTLASSSSALNLNHSIILTGLAVNSTYYYSVTSVDANSNNVSSIEYSFTTMETLSEESAVAAREAAARTAGANSVQTTSGGGGFLIIDKTDKVAPMISNITVSDIKSDSVKINWTTDEESASFAEYGIDKNYGNAVGRYDSVKNHQIILNNLTSETKYSFRVLSHDSSGNLAKSEDNTFATISMLEELASNKEALPQEKTPEERLSILDTIRKAIDIVTRFASQVSIGDLEPALNTQYDDLSKIIPSPLLSGEPKVITTATTATISWRTDKEANSLVAISPEDYFKASAGDNYRQVVGNPDERVKDHLVTISDLEPSTAYNYQVRSKAIVGPISKSPNFIFRTTQKTLEIASYSIDKVSSEKAVFKWATNIESNSAIKFIPYRNNVLSVEEAREKTDKAVTTIHEVEIDEFEGGVVYSVELISKDPAGNTASRNISAFSTSEDDFPPLITQVQTDSAISPGKETKVQTVIYWTTNEPSTSKVYFAKGFGSDENLSEETKMDQNYTKKHVVVVTKFDTGSVYRFRAESIDSRGNTTTSKTYTILTPRQKETVFQIIMKNVEDIFGWVGKINR